MPSLPYGVGEGTVFGVSACSFVRSSGYILLPIPHNWHKLHNRTAWAISMKFRIILY